MAAPIPQAQGQQQIGNFTTGQLGLQTPQQQNLQNVSIQNLLGMLQGGQSGFEPIAQQARQQFQTQTVPGLAERFTSLGGGQRSSAFQGALGQAGSGLENQLAALRSQYNLGQQGLLAQLGGGRSFENVLSPKQPGAWSNALTAFSGGLGAAIPSAIGAATGNPGSIADLIKKAFGGATDVANAAAAPNQANNIGQFTAQQYQQDQQRMQQADQNSQLYSMLARLLPAAGAGFSGGGNPLAQGFQFGGLSALR